jgi:uncharacterized protein (TIGR01244 family)
MLEYRSVTGQFAVAPQLSLASVEEIAAAGFRTVINNRPDSEAPGQPSSADIAAAAAAAGLDYRHLPFQGRPTPEIIEETAKALATASHPILAYCRTGTRSLMAWAMAQASAGAATPKELLAKAAGAGYDLGGLRGVLEQLSPSPSD